MEKGIFFCALMRHDGKNNPRYSDCHTQIMTAGPPERYLGEKALFKGSSSPSVTYPSIIPETEEMVNLHPVLIQGRSETNSAEGPSSSWTGSASTLQPREISCYHLRFILMFWRFSTNPSKWFPFEDLQLHVFFTPRFLGDFCSTM